MIARTISFILFASRKMEKVKNIKIMTTNEAKEEQHLSVIFRLAVNFGISRKRTELWSWLWSECERTKRICKCETGLNCLATQAAGIQQSSFAFQKRKSFFSFFFFALSLLAVRFCSIRIAWTIPKRQHKNVICVIFNRHECRTIVRWMNKRSINHHRLLSKCTLASTARLVPSRITISQWVN